MISRKFLGLLMFLVSVPMRRVPVSRRLPLFLPKQIGQLLRSMIRPGWRQ